MKKAVRIASCAMVMLMVALSSCTKDEDVVPDDAPPETFNGTWNVSENSKEYGASTYVATISSTTGSAVVINRLYSLTKGTNATVSGKNLTIPSQTIDGLNISGSALLENANRISFKYYVQITAKKTDTVASIFTK
ncbi:MAG TPA: hypothetical protein VFF27_13420 [Bacteroidia bacterium]|nr:hypothetical protein [Bacteroidia bacterium]